mgnify:CR=1 FL=1
MSDIQRLSLSLTPSDAPIVDGDASEGVCTDGEMRYGERPVAARAARAKVRVEVRGPEEATDLGAALNSTVEKNRLKSASHQARTLMATKEAHKPPPAPSPPPAPTDPTQPETVRLGSAKPTCPSCGEPVLNDAESYCATCGYPLKGAT